MNASALTLLKFSAIYTGRLIGVKLLECADPGVDVVEQVSELVEVHSIATILVKHACRSEMGIVKKP